MVTSFVYHSSIDLVTTAVLQSYTLFTWIMWPINLKYVTQFTLCSQGPDHKSRSKNVTKHLQFPVPMVSSWKEERCSRNSYANHEQCLQFGSSFSDERLPLITEANSMMDEKKRQNTSGCHRSQSRFSMLLMLLITTLTNKHSDKTLNLFTEAV